MVHDMSRWTFVDWVVTLGPFVIIAGIGYAAYQRSKP
jgi:hypothetical protein